MMMATFAVAGSLGALVRYVVSGVVQQRTGSSLPMGTAVVNLAGALALGLLVGAGAGETVLSVAAIGFTGGFTSFSTWMIETIGLGLIPRPSWKAVSNLVVLAALGVACAGLGYYVTS
jgi:fluoride exporter